MNIRLDIKYVGFLFLGLVLLFLYYLPSSAAFDLDPTMVSLGILFDCILTIPIIYFLLIRKTNIPTITVLYSIIIGLFIAGVIIPKDYHQTLELVKWIGIPLLEVFIISVLVYKIFKAKKSYTINYRASNEFFDNLQMAANDVFPGRIAKLLATEIAVFYYLFNTKKSANPSANEYSYHKNSGLTMSISILVILLIFETIALHFFIAKWSDSIAWIASGFSIYTGLQIVAILKSMNKRFIHFNYSTKQLVLNYGFACKSVIPFKAIKSVHLGNKKSNKTQQHTALSIFEMLESPNLCIILKDTRILEKLYGITKNYQSIGVYVDEKEEFYNEVKAIINE